MIKLAKNIFYVSIGEISSRLLNFITTIFLIRVFSVEDFGKINIAAAFFGYAVLLSVHWLNTFGIKKISAGEDSGFISEFISIRFGFSFIALILISIFLLFSSLDVNLKYLVLLFNLSLIPNVYFLDWYFQGKENLKPIAVGKFILSFIYLLFLYLFITHTGNVIYVGLAFLIANLSNAVFFLIYFYNKHKKLPSFSFKRWSEILKESFPLSSATVLSQFSVNLPVLLIGIFLSVTDVGIFSAAYKLVFFLLILDRFYYSIFFPAFMRVHKFQNQTADVFFNSAFKITLIVVFFIFSIFFLNAKELILLVYGANYQSSVIMFQILLVYFVLTITNSLISFGLIAVGEERYYSKAITFSVVLNLILMIVMINTFGVMGSAITIGIVELVIFTALFQQLRKFVRLRLTEYILEVILLNCLIIFVGLLFETQMLISSVLVSLIIYTIGILLFRIITKEDVSLFKGQVWS